MGAVLVAVNYSRTITLAKSDRMRSYIDTLYKVYPELKDIQTDELKCITSPF
ncbi:hypothetical protein KP78_30250 [Jeotgalibacillus soli]|uniref:Uncharacterized protein n=1 Tax=Jeotgalibacillus soli TaxID=889306 RepID=A0A0C2VLZ8_9BACL|nr:hypothetical protein KP78_30250 [Jeotgalibacillus soli]